MKYLYIIIITLVSLIAYSCSEPSIDDDAHEAAELSVQSNQYSMNNDFEKAGETYQRAQEIMNKYKKQDKFDEFYELYNNYLYDLYSNFLKESSDKLENTSSKNE